MRKIQLTIYENPNKSSPYKRHRLYRVGINGKHKLFGSEKRTIAFLNESSRFLNEKIAEVNMMHAEIYTTYRQFYLKFGMFLAYEKTIKDELMNIDANFFRFFHNTVGPNGNYFVFNFLLNIIDSQIIVCETISEVMLQLREDTSRFNLKILHNRLKEMRLKVSEYPTP